MLAATVYDLYKNWATLSADGALVIAVGFVSAFITAFLVVRAALDFIGRHGFAPFAYYRIVLGVIMLAILAAR
jgi:undecaprenyl-diphosphatase